VTNPTQVAAVEAADARLCNKNVIKKIIKKMENGELEYRRQVDADD
jgi:hypothetical protein